MKAVCICQKKTKEPVMQLTHFTDLGLRVLMYLSYQDRATPVTITEIATRFEISRNHLVKVVHFLAQQSWIITTRGKGGGMALAQPTASYRLGSVIRALEGDTGLIDCASPPCALRGNCQLKSILDIALADFYSKLDSYTLADAVTGSTSTAIIMLHQIGVASLPQPRPVS